MKEIKLNNLSPETGVDKKPTSFIDLKNLSHLETFDTFLSETPEINYSSKLDDIIVTGFLKRDDNYQIKVYEGKTHTLRGDIEAHKLLIHKAVLLPDELLATVSADQTVKIWRLLGIAMVFEIKLDYVPFDLSVNPETMVAYIFGKSPKISCYNIKSGSAVREIMTENLEGYNTCVFLEKYNAIVAGVWGQHILHLINCKTGKVASQVDAGKDVSSIIGMQLVEPSSVVTAGNNVIHIWDTWESGIKLRRKITPPLKKIAHFTVIEDHDAILVTHLSPTIYIYKYSDGSLVKFLPTKMQKCYGIKFARATEKIFVTDAADGAVSVFVNDADSKKKNSCNTCRIF